MGDAAANEASGASLSEVAVEASMLLFEASGRQFPGLCERTVRPCRDRCSCWNRSIPGDVALPSFGYYGGLGWGFGHTAAGAWCGCQPLSRVKLAGYPARAITEVRIDGVALDELDTDGNPNWRLDGWRWLTRMSDPAQPSLARRWPGCQNLALDDDQPGTFSITYQYGNSPPPLGVAAASELAGELYNACNGGDCRLPASVTRVVREGVTIDRVNALAALLREGASGIPLVDAFIAAYPVKGTRRPAVWSPDTAQFARKAGV
jgi:hypothetical protein